MSQISANVLSGPYTGNGVQTAFAFNFSIVTPTGIEVQVDGAIASPSLYTVAYGDVSGTVTFLTPPVNGAQILLLSNPDYFQTSNFDNQGAYNLATINLINRRSAIRDLVLKDKTDRALKMPRGQTPGLLPSAAELEGRVIGFSGGAFVGVANDAVTVAGDLARAEAAANDADASAAEAASALATIEFQVAQNPKRSSKAADTSVVSSTALIGDPELQVPLGANSFTLLRGNINYSASAAGDLKWRHTGPAAPASLQIKRRAFVPGATDYSAKAVDTAYSAGDIVLDGAAGSGFIEFEAVIANGATAGNFVFQWAQNTSDATATIVKAGSYIEYVALPTVSSFAFANAAIAALGVFAAANSGGHNYVTATLSAANSRIEVMATGARCDLQISNGLGNYTVTIDGGAPATIVPGAGWTFATLFSGLSDTPHRVRVSGAFYDTDITFKVFGVAPMLSRPADIPNFYVLGSAPFTTYAVTESVSSLNTAIYPSPYQREWAVGSGFGLRFSATTTSVRVWMYDGLNPSRIVLAQDGVDIATITPPGTTGGYELITLATGLSGSHEYEIKMIDSGHPTDIFAVLVDALDAVAHTARAMDAWYGDSIVLGTVAGITYDARLHSAYILAHSLGRSAIRVGVGGSRVVNYGRDNTAKITGLPQAATRVFVPYGVNDMQAYTGAGDITAFQTAYQTMLANIRTGLPSAKIYALGIFPVASAIANSAQRSAYNTAIAAAVTAIADANIVYRSTDGWIDPTIGVDTIEGLHPNTSGYAKIAAALALVL